MRRILLILISFSAGFGLAFFIFETNKNIAHEKNEVQINEKMPTEKSKVSEEANSENTNQTDEKNQEKIIQTKTITKTVMVEKQCPESPVCPCLFSNKILPPPQYDEKLPENLVTNFEGEVLVRWQKVDGAKKYEIHLEDESGKLVKVYKTPNNALYLKDIPLPVGKFEAHYKIKLASVNGKDEAGKKGTSRPLHLKPQASVVAPEIQEIKVEE